MARTGERVKVDKSDGIVTFSSGAQAFLYSGACPEKLRGPEHHFAWCDELAKWRYPEETWDNLQLGLRLGAAPRALVTTTPKAVPLAQAADRDGPAGGADRAGGRRTISTFPPPTSSGWRRNIGARGRGARSWTAS